jgi:hypothetical protein
MHIAMKFGAVRLSITADPHNKLSNKAYGRLGLKKTNKPQMRYEADTSFMKQFTSRDTQRNRT